jgi:NAD(P)H dehydrogenase (quinone)
MAKILVLHHSYYGHIEKMAQAVAEGAREVAGATVDVKRVPETVPAEVFAASHGKADQAAPLIGKVGSVFTSSATQHGGQESTILTFHPTLLHHGMVVVGLPYAEARQMGLDEIKGGSPYGASTIAGGQGERQPSEQELGMARFQGRHVAGIATKLFG